MRKFLSIFLSIFLFASSVLATDWYMDYENGSDDNGGTGWQDAWKTFTRTPYMSPGDRLKIAKSMDPISLGGVTWTYGEREITLAEAVTATVDNCESGWVAATEVNVNFTPTYRKEGTYNVQIMPNTAFTTGKLAYKQITEIDFSNYHTISFWIRVTSIVSANALKLCLCSDTTGDTIVNSVIIDWELQSYDDYRIAINTGGALGSSIQSVALYADLDPGTPTIYLDNIFAANDIHLRSLISKNTEGLDKIWYMPEYFDNTTIGLFRLGGNGRYAGTSEIVTTYYRNPIYLPVSDHYDTTGRFEILDSGSSGNLLTISGGWNTSTDMRDGETFFMGQNTSYNKGIDGIFYLYRREYISYENLGAFESYYNFNLSSAKYYLKLHNCWSGGYYNRGFWIEDYSPGFDCELDHLYVTNDRATTTGFYIDIQENTFTENYDTLLDNLYASGCYSAFSTLGYTRKMTLQNSNFSGNRYGLRVDTWLGVIVDNVICKENYINLYSVSWNRDCIIKNSTFADYTDYNFGYSYNSSVYLEDCIISDGLSAQSDGNRIAGYYTDSPKFFISKNQKEGSYVGTIYDQITAGYSAQDARGGSGYCIVMDPFNSISGRDLDFVIAVPVTSGKSFTFDFYHKITTGFTGNLTFSAKGAGITPIENSSVTLTDDGVWHEYISPQMTPSADGWVKITLKTLHNGILGKVFLDDFEVSQGADKELGNINGGFPVFEHDMLVGGGGSVTTAFTYTE